MRCLKCHVNNPRANRFCEICGTRLAVICRHCGHQLQPDARFCGSCGTQNEPLQGPRASPIGFTADAGELKHATVLFADIVSSTELIAHLDPEQAMIHLKPAVTDMCHAVDRFSGSVMRTLGDGIMALFGAPRSLEGHAFLACEAALAMRESIGRSAGLAIRVGLHSGEVLADPSNGDDRRGGAHGFTLHLGSRVTQFAEPGTIYLTDSCYRLVRPYYDVQALGERVLRGVPQPVSIYALTAPKSIVANQPTHRTHLASLRGRTTEMTVLQNALAHAEDGRAMVIGIVGNPGAGKSRLCFEFAMSCRGRSIPVFEIPVQPREHATPLQPVLEILRSLYFGLEPLDGNDTSRQRVAECLSRLGPSFAADLPIVWEFLGLSEETADRTQLPPHVRRLRLLKVLRQLVREHGVTTSVIIMNDLHWLDDASGDFIAALAEAVAGTHTMLVLNYRPSYACSWAGLEHFSEIRLAELPPAETDALVDELIGTDPTVADIGRQVAERSGGNPFFAEELMRALVEGGSLVGEAGNYRLGVRQAGRLLPPTIHVAIANRIDHLEQFEKSLLQIAAVIGKRVPLAVLQRLAGAPAAGLARALRRLSDSGLIQAQRAPDGTEYVFRHPLFQEVAYTTQTQARRRALHAAVAATMEAHYKDEPAELAALLAYHYEASEQMIPAASHTARAARWIGRTSTLEATRLWQKVINLLAGGEASPLVDSLLILANAQISLLAWRPGQMAKPGEGIPHVREALRIARTSDRSVIPLLLFSEARLTGATGGSADKYTQAMRDTLALADSQSHRGRATLNASLCQAYGWAGLLREALAASDTALATLPVLVTEDDEFLGFSVKHWLLSLRARILARLGRGQEAAACASVILDLRPELVDPTVQFIVHLAYVEVAWSQNDAANAAKHAAAIAVLAERHDSPYLRVYAWAAEGFASALSGDFAVSEACFTRSLQAIRSARLAMNYEADVLAGLAECLFQSGDFARAAAMAREAVEIALARNSRLAELRARITLGAAAAAGSRLDEAATEFELAQRLIRLTGAIIYQRSLTEMRAIYLGR